MPSTRKKSRLKSTADAQRLFEAIRVEKNRQKSSENKLDKYFGMLNHESNLKLGDSGSSISLKATKKGKYLMSSIFRVKIKVKIIEDKVFEVQ